MNEDYCVVCYCLLSEENRAQWTDHCEDCETEGFEFYGAVGEEQRKRTAWHKKRCRGHKK